MTKNQDKNLNIFFKWLSVAENCLRPESAPLSEGFSRENFFVFFFGFFWGHRELLVHKVSFLIEKGCIGRWM